MWKAKSETLSKSVSRTVLLTDGVPLRYEQVILLWRDDESFCEFLSTTLAASPFEAYFWETPPITRATWGRPFEFVLVESGDLSGIQADPNPFQKKFDTNDSPDYVVSFMNLGGDAMLVAPCPAAELSAYPHMAAFVRKAPRAQQNAFWRMVGEKLDSELGTELIWLSTAGLGVSWLHVRLDSRPKYYQHLPYATAGRQKAVIHPPVGLLV